MTYTVTKKGHESWADLKGKRVSFAWSDGWEEHYPHMVFSNTSVYAEDPRYPRYYVLDDSGGGVSFWEDEPVEVTVHEDAPWPPEPSTDPDAFEPVGEDRFRWSGGKPPGDKEREIIERRRNEGVTLSLTIDEAKALEGVLEKLRQGLTKSRESGRLEE